jgi:CBS domain-containing protein
VREVCGRDDVDMTDDAGGIPISGGAAPVRVFAADTVVTMPSDATLQAVADALAGGAIGIVVLGSVDDVDGVVSERDVVRAVAGRLDPPSTPAGDVASRKLVWCDATASIREVAERMMEEYVRHVLLEEEGRLVGIVSARDVLSAYALSPD